MSILKYIIALVWLVNGLYCKVLNGVPRHQQIIAEILGTTYARWLSVAIGFSEIVMALWIISGYKKRLNAVMQILVVLLMNIIEFLLVPDLLLWGRFNALFALLFVGLIYCYEFLWSEN